MLVANRYRKTISASSSRKRDPADRSMEITFYLSYLWDIARRVSFANSTRDLDRDRESAVPKEKRPRFLLCVYSACPWCRLACIETSTKKGRLDLTVTKTYFRGFLRDTYTHLRVHTRTLTKPSAVAQRASSWRFRRTIRRTAPFPIFNWLSSLNPSHSPSFLSNFHPLAFRERI